jgi:thiol:disulfide interchange protein
MGFHMTVRPFLALFACFLIPALAPAQVPDIFGEDQFLKSFEEAADFTAVFSPSKAKPGQVVTLQLTITPKLGCWTYPGKPAKEQTGVNTFVLPKEGDVLFLQNYEDPPQAKVKKADGSLYYPMEVTWNFKAIVNPAAKPGKRPVELVGTRLQVCNTKNCVYYGNLTPVSAEMEVLDGPAEKVPDEFKSLVAPPPAPAPLGPTTPPTVTPPAEKPTAGHEGLVKKDAISPAEHDARLKELLATLQKQEVKREGGLWTLLLTAAAWGLISLVTPCVFPMIPITVSLFLKQSNQSAGGAVKLAMIYCATIIAVMTAAAAFALASFRAMSVDPYMNIALGALFVVLALSLFGMFNLELPGFLLRYTEGKRKGGGTLGTVFGAIAFSIVSFTCVAPFLGGFAGMSASGQYGKAEILLAGVAFATAFASPFFVLALFPSLLKRLPKSGGWLDRVKAVMGFLEVAAALKFFRTAELLLTERPTFFTYDVVLAGWVVIMVVCGLYLLNLFRLPHDHEESPPPVGVIQLLFALAFIGLGLYLLPATFKTAKGQQRPGGVVFNWVDAFLLPDPSSAGSEDELPWNSDLPAVVESARKENKLVFVDFTGVSCTNCKDNERNVFPLKTVDPLIRKYKLASMYTDTIPAEFYKSAPSSIERVREATANLRFQKDAFGTEQLPLYVIFEPLPGKGVRVVGVYAEGKINDREAFINFLKTPLEMK